MKNGTDRVKGHGEKKAPYSTPKLAVYGDLRVITESMNRTGSDGATGASNKST
jgi:hypothetical protein